MSPGAGAPGAEVSRCAVPQHRVGQRLIGHQPLPPTVRALPFFQPLGRVDPQPPVLPPPAVIRWLGHAAAARDLRDRFPRREHPLRLPQVADDRLGRVPLACHADSLRTGPNPRTGSGPVLGGQGGVMVGTPSGSSFQNVRFMNSEALLRILVLGSEQERLH